jgi:3-isopropylmalate/(R)-2-methylmalate dehydratase small subunit
MQEFTIVTGAAAPIPGANIDTDVIMPKQFLKGIDRSGLREGTFFDLRFDPSGAENPGFILNRAGWRESRFLVVGPNFGCGSSREHAVWGLGQLGIRALIGTSFAGIFFDNCAHNGLLAITVEQGVVEQLMALACDPECNALIIDLPKQTIQAQDGSVFNFDIDAGRKESLILGLDAVATTLQRRAVIQQFEAAHFAQNPWLG